MAVKTYTLQNTGPEVQEAITKSLDLQNATQAKAGLMSASDKIALDGVPEALSHKVDKESGKGLSQNDYSDAEKSKVASAYQKPVSGIPASDLAEGVIPDVSQFITNSVNDLVNYYLKSETYTKTEVDTLVGAVNQFSYETAAELPTASASTMWKIYLIPSTEPKTQNIKDEYITLRSGTEGSYTYSWEQIGSTAIDLSDYVTTQQLTTALSAYTTTANLTTLLAGKQDTISDLSTIRTGAAAGATAYQKPSGGIPKTDLASGVQSSLDLADSAIQAEPVGSITPPADPSAWATTEQVEQLEAKVDENANLQKPISGTWRQGTLLTDGHAYSPNFSTRIVVAIPSTKPILLKVASGYYVGVHCFSETYSDIIQNTTGEGYLGQPAPTGWKEGNLFLEPLSGCKTWVITVKKGAAGTDTLTPSDGPIAVTEIMENDSVKVATRQSEDEITALRKNLALSQNETVLVPDLSSLIQGYLNTASPYEYKGVATDNYCVLIDISAYHGKILRVRTVSATIAFLQNNTLVSGSAPQYSATYTTPIYKSGENIVNYVIPNDANYLYVYMGTSSQKKDVTLTVMRGTPFTISGLYLENSVTINTLWFREIDDSGLGIRIVFNQTLTFGNLGTASEFLVLTDGNTLALKPQAGLLTTDLVLLIWASSLKYYGGVLYDDYLNRKISSIVPSEEVKSVKVGLVAGSINGTDGIQYGAVDTLTNMTRYFCTENFLNIDYSKMSVRSIGNPAGTTVTVFAYGLDFSFIGAYDSLSNVPSSTKHIKFVIAKSSDFTEKELQVTVQIGGVLRDGLLYSKNDSMGESPLWISYEIQVPLADNNVDGSSYVGEMNRRAYTNGCVFLPPNYTRDGKPFPLIIIGHGTGCYTFDIHSNYYYEHWGKFLAKCGYIVADCCSISSLYGINGGGVRDCNTPTNLAMSCYLGLYKTVCNRFNVDTKNVFMYGHSAGGLLTTIFGFTRMIPLKAIAGHAPSTELVSNMRVLTPAIDQNFFLHQIGLDDANIQGANALLAPDADAKAYYIAHASALIGYNPFTMGSDIDNATLVDKILSVAYSTSGYESSADLVSLVHNAHKVNLCPMKIWHSVDDTNVPIAESRFFRDIIRNAGGICYVREFPNGSGGHGAVGGNSQNPNALAPKTNYTTRLGETVENIPVAYAEMVDWFNSYLD